MSVTIRGALAGANTSAKWLTVGQEGDVKIVLEAPGSELANAFRLAGLLGQELEITFRTPGVDFGNGLTARPVSDGVGGNGHEPG